MVADVGVVMPVYTQNPEFLHQAIESVLRQTFTDYRLIIVIDGDPQMEPLVKVSTNNDPRVTIVSYLQNRGIAYALNTGFRILFDDPNISYLTWVSSDNVYEPLFLEVMRTALVKGPQDLGLVYSSFQSIDNNGTPLHDEHQLAALRKYQSQPKEKLLDSSIIGVCFMYKAQVAKRVGKYGMEPVEDYDFWLRLAEYCEIRYIPVELVNYRVYSTYSVSAQLMTTEQHRKWRYAFHLTRLQARCRRNILPAITILYPVLKSGPEELERLEQLYEQTFSNYVCRVLDLSLCRQPSAILASVSHPVTEFVWMPGVPLYHALSRAVVEGITTPFILILGPNPFMGYMDIEYMLENLIKTGGTAISNFYTDDHTLIGYRHKDAPSTKKDLYNELFRSADLKNILSTSTSKMLYE